MARALYETRTISMYELGMRLGVEGRQLCQSASRQEWISFPNRVAQIVEQVQSEIMSEALKKRPGRPVNGKKPFKHPTRKGGNGRKPIYARDREAKPVTEEQKLMRKARDLFEAGKANKAQISKMLSIPVSRLYHAARVECWVDPRVAKAKEENPASFAHAGLIIPPPSPDTARAQMQITLAAIRAVASVQQVHQLDALEGVLDKLRHLVDVYLSPEQFLELEALKGLPADELAERVAKIRVTALRMLAPTDRDTFAGTLKTYVDALFRSIELKRHILGLNKLELPSEEQVREHGDDRHFIASMSTEQLRVIQHGMELLQQHQHAGREIPMPPHPAPIDDLLGPEAQVMQDPELRR